MKLTDMKLGHKYRHRETEHPVVFVAIHCDDGAYLIFEEHDPDENWRLFATDAAAVIEELPA